MDAAQRVDLAIRGGVIVTASSRYRADIGVRDGRITQIGGDFSADREIDANGKLVLPGGIDMHVHLTAASLPEGGEVRWADDFESGTRAAVAGGLRRLVISLFRGRARACSASWDAPPKKQSG